METVKHPIALLSAFIWIGFVSAISFMEAWLKFQAPGVSLQIGLGIGRLVFDALNKVEWVFAIAIIVNLIFDKSRPTTMQIALFSIPVILLSLQTIWLLPILDARAELIIQNQIPPSSNVHFYYIGMEVIKVVCLSLYGVSQFKKS